MGPDGNAQSGKLVEAPGTAPGSTTLILRTVYRHSRQADGADIAIRTAGLKGFLMRLTDEQLAEIDAQRTQTAATSRPTVPALEALLFQPVPVLDHGFVRLIDYMGDDAAVVQAARVSYGRGTRRVSEDAGLIRYLMRHRHSTPFEMCEIKYHVKLPLFVARQWIRHRTANVNEYSARYSILDREFYIPEPQHLASQSTGNRQGRGDVLTGDEAADVLELLRTDAARNHDHYTVMLNEDTKGMPSDPHRRGLARELARMNLTLNTYTQWYWKTDLHNLLQFLSLRADPRAQYEIRVYAEAMLETVKAWVPATFAAFRDYRLEAVTFSGPMLAVLRRMLAGEAVAQAESGLSKREWTEMMDALSRKESALLSANGLAEIGLGTSTE
jgi:thymidylate synthase (FAD)